jgi:hypothetical protein
MAWRSRYEGPMGIASVLLDAARHRGIASLTVMGQAPHYLQPLRAGPPRETHASRRSM